jgi:hypothetical protein
VAYPSLSTGPSHGPGLSPLNATIQLIQPFYGRRVVLRRTAHYTLRGQGRADHIQVQYSGVTSFGARCTYTVRWTLQSTA